MTVNWTKLVKLCEARGFVKADFVGLIEDIAPTTQDLHDMVLNINDPELFETLIRVHHVKLNVAHWAILQTKGLSNGTADIDY